MIKVLPANIAGLIAAGEVVGRPSSVVKELVENSLDAGASSVKVLVTDAGRTSIQIIDDGCGMDGTDAELCFQKHATSKLSTAEDLQSILTYGFRGEALASIAAVAEVTLKTRREIDEVGTWVEISGSGLNAIIPTSCPKGCNIEVRNLFYNIPARRKFLKSDSAEMRSIIQEFLRVALIHPETSFSLTSNGKTLYDLRPARNIEQRICDACGRELQKELVEISTDTTVVRIKGFVGKPEAARKAQGNQYFFINGRYFRSPFFHKAVCRPYERLIPEGYSPSYFIFLETDPSAIDVNIHPQKTEIKFEDDTIIFEILSASVREALGKNSFVPSIDFETASPIDFPIMEGGNGVSSFSCSNSGFGSIKSPKIDYDPLFDPFDLERRLHGGDNGIPPEEKEEERLFEDVTSDMSRANVIPGGYLVFPVRDGLMIINIRRGRERIFYDRYFPLLAERNVITCQSLIPESLPLTPEERLLFEENAETLSELGFSFFIEENSLLVKGMPEGFESEAKGARKSVDSLLETMKEGSLTDNGAQRLAETMAKSAAASAPNIVTSQQAQQLVDQLLKCPVSAVLPDGRKVFTIITLEELENRI